jgi:hypothetical protein
MERHLGTIGALLSVVGFVTVIVGIRQYSDSTPNALVVANLVGIGGVLIMSGSALGIASYFVRGRKS